MRPLLALSSVIIDRIRESDGTEHPPMAGGAGLYAAAAMSMWWPSVALVAGVGTNFNEITGALAQLYGFDPRGLIVRGDNCIESLLAYAADGTRTETPTFGNRHFESMQIAPEDIDPGLLPAAGTYIFRGADADFWNVIGARRAAFGRVLWEIDARLAEQGDVEAIARLVPMVDILSLNLAEAVCLFGQSSAPSLASKLQGLGVSIVALRMGAEGALLVRGSEALHIQPPRHPVIDVTGGGNAFSGGLLAGLTLYPDDLAEAGRHAAAAAACIISQRGLPAPPTQAQLAALAAAAPVHPVNL